jgi:uncharacterized membrane protein YeaQ/YmgE (transglycosylase-associated protein family)
MPLIIIAVALVIFLAIAGVIWVTFGLIGLLLQLFMAGLVGALADAVVPGRLPWGWLGAILAGLVGGWLGTLLIGRVGPTIFSVPVVPAFVGAVILAFALSAIGRLQLRSG